MTEKFAIELLDIAYLGAPSLERINVDATAERITKLRGKDEGKWGYDPAFERFARAMAGASLDDLLAELAEFKRKVQRDSCADVLRLLNDNLAGPGRLWVPYKRYPMQLYEKFFFTGVARGILRRTEGDFAIFVNPRKTLPNDPLASTFFGRGTFEAHLRDELSLKGGYVLDLASPRRGAPRSPRLSLITSENMMALDQFDHVCRVFFEGAVKAGFLAEAPKERHYGDLFRKASRL